MRVCQGRPNPLQPHNTTHEVLVLVMVQYTRHISKIRLNVIVIYTVRTNNVVYDAAIHVILVHSKHPIKGYSLCRS